MSIPTCLSSCSQLRKFSTQWPMHCVGASHRPELYDLDDYIIVAPLDSDECARAVHILEDTCAALGVPLAAHKSEGPVTSLVFLGIVVDTMAGELLLQEGTLERLKSLLQWWGSKRVCCHRELESLIGLLNHACKVVCPGCSFLRSST